MAEQTTPLRQRMIDDMTIRNMAPSTRAVYIRAVKNFALYFKRSPDKLCYDDVREYHLHLVARKLQPQTINQIMFWTAGKQVGASAAFGSRESGGNA